LERISFLTSDCTLDKRGAVEIGDQVQVVAERPEQHQISFEDKMTILYDVLFNDRDGVGWLVDVGYER
jgi:hypothetical protein